MDRVRNYLIYWLGQILLLFSQEWDHLRALKLKRNHILSDPASLIEHGKVNIHYWRRNDGGNNLGDDLSPVICSALCHHFGIDHSRELTRTKHLYAVGSILGFGCQNATVWGSGLLNPYRLYMRNIKSANLDIRAVRGPLTRDYLVSIGVPCPAVFGDPAVLLPMLYTPDTITKQYAISVISHYTQDVSIPDHMHRIRIDTNNYQFFINEIVASELVISSSLHGIILAESYGIPAILWNERGVVTFKMKDYYYSTNRYDIPVIKSLQDIDCVQPIHLPVLDDMRKSLLEAFPRDLWNN